MRIAPKRARAREEHEVDDEHAADEEHEVDDERTAHNDTLAQLLGCSSSYFFSSHWEKRPFRCVGCQERLHLWASLPELNRFLSLLVAAQESPGCNVIMLKDQHPTEEYASPAAAYLDGCSIIVNHAERACGGIAALCVGLRGALPHAFGNLYLTPPLGQAVDAHADDRDVLVLQLVGTKHWKVYTSPPVPFPMSDEQVGKAGRAVPESATSSGVTEHVLGPGDVLYIPRGHVHEACTSAAAPSLHLTIALATEDWCWGKLAARALARSTDDGQAATFLRRALSLEDDAHQTLTRNGPTEAEAGYRVQGIGHTEAQADPRRARWFWRRSVPPALVCPHASAKARAASLALAASVEEELGLAGGQVKPSQVTPNQADDEAAGDGDGCAGGRRDGGGGSTLTRLFAEQVTRHNGRQDAEETARAAAAAQDSQRAHQSLTPASYVRRRRADEPVPEGCNQGLRVRDEIADALTSSLALLTTQPSCIGDFQQSELLCDFGRVCFAQVCIDAGLLVACDPVGHAL